MKVLSKFLKIAAVKDVNIKNLIPGAIESLVNLGYEITIIDLNIEENDAHKTAFTALKTGEIDIAIFHLPDFIPTKSTIEFVIAALSERMNAQYCLIINENHYDSQADLRLKTGTTVNTSTNMQTEQLKKLCPKIQTIESKLSYENIVDLVNSSEISAAVIPKIYLDSAVNTTQIKSINLHPKEMIPAPGQGTFAFVTLTDNLDMRRVLKTIHQKDVSEVTNVERKVRQMLPENDQPNVSVYCYKDINTNFHAFGAFFDVKTSSFKLASQSQSTSDGLSDNIYHSLFINN